MHDIYTQETALVARIGSWLNDPVANQDTAPVASVHPGRMSVDAAARINAFIKYCPGVRMYALLDNTMIRIREVMPVDSGEWVNCVTYDNKRDDARLCVRASSHFICLFASEAG